ncbi:MAG: PSD1 and planctomycete cytochrome C domain-containing protein [Mariniblastus sp.]|nr:PSD1 and planctomycete cytochrome C domain-containing protein [Mariniblastus sp.]
MKTRFAAALLFALSPFFGDDARAQTDEPVDFASQVLPILSSKCFLCHGPDAQDDSLVRLDSYTGATVDLGGSRAIDPDQPEQSEILVRIHSADDPMPPDDATHPLTDAERELLDRWVRQGGAYTDHWALVAPIQQAPEPASADANPIDGFIETPLQAAGIALAAPAARETLARRAALVLTGLPPEPAWLETFLNDNEPGAYERLVDRLLASPRFGEHQARYWLDAVRYGDTHGLHLDNRRGIYPYRDWVVKAYNDNLPVDDFITWQLAGDLLPNPTLQQRVATGFVRLNPTTGEGGAIPDEFQAKNNFDRVETFGTVFLGQSLTCARCHTHKYDPIEQEDYYRLLAFFNSTAEPAMDGNAYEYGTVARAPANQVAWTEWEELAAARAKLISDAEKDLDHLQLSQGETQRWQNGSLDERLTMLADPHGPFGQRDQRVYAQVVQTGSTNAQKQFTTTLIARDLPKPRPTRLLQRGEYDLPVGEPLEPTVLPGMGAMPDGAPGNRLGLAQWLTSPDHPLTARVMVNQVWQRVFGDGLVRTPEDFGVMGQQPTHPELLDWLAVDLQQHDWDLKRLMKMMVTSRTFCQNSAHRTDLDDPENRLFARGPSYRLDAEVLRDIGLWASELLDPTMGGEGVKPYQPPGMWLAMAHPGSNTKNYVADQGERLYRRSLYVYWKRSSPHPMMTLFDAPSREASCVRRSPTNTSLQSLALMNETQRVEMARKLAERLVREEQEEGARLERLFRLLACRAPSDTERATCLSLLAAMQERFQQDKPAAETLLAYGDAPRDKKLDAAQVAAWTQVTTTLLASDTVIQLY